MSLLSTISSKLISFVSPTQDTGPRRNPKRNAQKRPDDNFIYPTSQSSTSILLGTTLSESQLELSNTYNNDFVPDTQTLPSGNDSLFYDSQSQTVVPETQTDSPQITMTPLSHHGSKMRLSLSPSLSDSQSLLPMSDLSIDDTCASTPLQSSQAIGTPIINSLHSEDANSQTAILDKSDKCTQTTASYKCDITTETDHAGPTTLSKVTHTSQTVHLHTTFENVSLFRSNGNLPTLSNFYSTKLIYKGILFKSAEHAYQHHMAMYHSRPDIARKILRSPSAVQAKNISHSVTKCKQWHEAKSNIMADILKVKAEQCPAFRKTLIATKSNRLIHNIDTDSFWGCGPDLCGTNMLGVLLEELRTELCFKLQTDSIEVTDTATDTVPTPTNAPVLPVSNHINLTSQDHLNANLAPRANSQVSPQRKTKEPNAPQPPGPAKTVGFPTDTHLSPSETVESLKDTPDVQQLPAPEPDPVVFIGNSNVRHMTTILRSKSINAQSVFYPGGTLDYIRSRIRHTCYEPDPSHIILMAGDIEAADGMPPSHVNAKYERLVREIRRIYPYSRLILVGMAMTGNPRRRQTITCLNALMQHIASCERMVAYANNNNARLKDNIHLSIDSKKALGRHIAQIVKKPHLDSIKWFR